MIKLNIPIAPVPASRPRVTKTGHAYDTKQYSKFKRESIPDDWGKHEQQTPVDAKKKAELEERIKKLREKGNKK